MTSKDKLILFLDSAGISYEEAFDEPNYVIEILYEKDSNYAFGNSRSYLLDFLFDAAGNHTSIQLY